MTLNHIPKIVTPKPIESRAPLLRAIKPIEGIQSKVIKPMDELKTESIRRVSEDTSHEINSNGLADSLMLKVKEKINYRQFNRMYTMVVREETPPRTTSNLSSRLKSKS